MKAKPYILYLFLALLLLGSVAGCGPVREIQVKEVEKVVIKDTTIFKRDTITIEVPKETIKEVLPEIDTSILETSLAVSTAYLDTLQRVIHHTLKNKEQTIQKEVETPVRTVTKTEYKEKEVPVEVPLPVVPKWCWILVIFNVAFFGFKLVKLLHR